MENIESFIDSYHGHIYGYCHEHWLTLQIFGTIAVALLVMAVFYGQKYRTIAIVVNIVFLVLSIAVTFFYFYNRTMWGEKTSEFAVRALIPLCMMGTLAYSTRHARTLSKGTRGIAAFVFVVIAWYFLESFVFVDIIPANVLINWG